MHVSRHETHALDRSLAVNLSAISRKWIRSRVAGSSPLWTTGRRLASIDLHLLVLVLFCSSAQSQRAAQPDTIGAL